MKKFKATILVPQERIVEAVNMQEAHNQMSAMMNGARTGEENVPHPIMHSIVEIKETVTSFGPSPAA